MSITTIQLIKDGAAASTNTVTSKAVRIEPYVNVSIHFWLDSGTPTGSFNVQVSNYENALVDGYSAYQGGSTELGATITKWVDLSSVKCFPETNAYTATAITAGTPAQIALNLDELAFKFLRVVYVNSAGSGVFQVRMMCKRNKSTSV